MNHMGTKPLQNKTNFHKSRRLWCPAPEAPGQWYCKLCTCETVRDRKFLKSCDSRLLDVHSRRRGPEWTYRAMLFSFCAPTKFPLTSSWLLTHLSLEGISVSIHFDGPRDSFLPVPWLLDQPALHFLALFFAWRRPEADLQKLGTAVQKP